jgi:energy-coupling factor transporter transmembrane protein EcfT
MLFLAILVIAIPVFLGSRDTALYGIPFSPTLFQTHVAMAHRSIIILLAIRILTLRIPLNQMERTFERLRLHRFSRVFSVAMDLLPQVRSLAQQSIQDLRQTRRTKNWVSHSIDQVSSFLAHLLILADQMENKEEQGKTGRNRGSYNIIPESTKPNNQKQDSKSAEE